MRPQSCPLPRHIVEQRKLAAERAVPARVASIAIARRPVARETLWPAQASLREAQVKRA
ncbi:MAG TPA: hypothetical protein VN579_07295 [Bryobacteraceae bacterium]|nr:hypothetical protein [Bryobacteraceae bacterium]